MRTRLSLSFLTLFPLMWSLEYEVIPLILSFQSSLGETLNIVTGSCAPEIAKLLLQDVMFMLCD